MALQAVRHEDRPEPTAASPSDRRRTAGRRWIVLALAGWITAGAAALVAAEEWRRAEQLTQLAGMTAVTGRGVEVTISDPRQSPASGGLLPAHAGAATPHATQPPRSGQLVVTDGDLIVLNMLLWYGGARAVAINNQRITAQTTITSSGPAILINGARIVGPFRIAALGDPDTLKGVLRDAGLIEQMRSAGIDVSMSTQAALRVPPWRPGAETAR